MDYNIPQGRGMIKWAPFATMPEQFENVRTLHENNTHVPKPNLNTDLQQELELKLRELIGQNVILRYWSDSYEFQDECIIEGVDEHVSMITVSKNDEIMFIKFEHVYEVIEYDFMLNLN